MKITNKSTAWKENNLVLDLFQDKDRAESFGITHSTVRLVTLLEHNIQDVILKN
jgi:hypothetical protein